MATTLEIDNMNTKNTTIQDKCNLNYMACLLIGTASLLPNNCLFAAMDYITQFHPTDKIIFPMNNIMDISNFTAISFLILFNRIVPITFRIIFFTTSIAILLIITPSYLIKHRLFVFFIAAFSGCTAGTLSVSIIAYAQIFSDQYVQIAYIGQSLSALTECVLRFTTKLLCSTHETSAKIYFFCSSVVLLIGVLLFALSLTTQFSKYHRQLQTKCQDNIVELHIKADSSYRLLVATVSIFIHSFVTFTIYPTLLLTIQSQWNLLNSDGWIQLVLMSIFCVGDFIGAQFIIFDIKLNILFVLSIIRICFIPIAVGFNKSWWINDILLFIFTLIVGVTQGQFGCQIFMKYTQLLRNDAQETSVAIMQFSLCFGIVCGGVFSTYINCSIMTV
eukprot:177483_1